MQSQPARGSTSQWTSADVQQKSPVPSKKRKQWSNEEHMLFLFGLCKYGKGNWTKIATNCVVSKTPTQVASHAQKFFLNQKRENKKRKTIHDITWEDIQRCMASHHINQLPPLQNCGLLPQNHIHPPNVAMHKQELQQPQQILHSNPTNNLPQQQMSGYETPHHVTYHHIHHSAPQDWDVKKQQQYQKFQQALKMYLSQNNFPQQIDDEIQPLAGVAMQQQEFQQSQLMLHSNPTNNLLQQQMSGYETPHNFTYHHNHHTPPKDWDVAKQQQYQGLQQALKTYPSPNNSPQQIDDGYGIQPLAGVAMHQQEFQQSQPMLHSNPKNMLPQQMDGYETYHVTNHHNHLPPPQNLGLPPNVKLQQLQELKEGQIDGHGIQPSKVGLQKAQLVSVEECMEIPHQVINHNNPLPSPWDWTEDLEVYMQELDEYQQSQQVCNEGCNQRMVVPQVTHHHKQLIRPRKVNNFDELAQKCSNYENFNNY